MAGAKRTIAPVLAAGLKGAYLLVLMLLVGFGLSVGLGGLLKRNAGWEQPDPATEPSVPILIGTNGVHTEIVMPARTGAIDWHGVFPPSDLALPPRGFTHVAVSWGERTFFLETETWADLDPMIGARALSGGDAIFHIAHYVRPAPSEDYRVLHLAPAQYERLVRDIEGQLVSDHRATRIEGYADHDLFYDARGTYHLGNTCNQWTADRLAGAGVSIGWWTPLAGGVMQAIPANP